MTGPLLWLAVAGGSACGAVMRHLVDTGLARLPGRGVPLGTLVVNLTGAFAIGLLAGIGPGDDVRLLVGTALVGSYTTFSTWMVQTVALAGSGRAAAAVANLSAHVVLGLALAAAGFGLAVSAG